MEKKKKQMCGVKLKKKKKTAICVIFHGLTFSALFSLIVHGRK